MMSFDEADRIARLVEFMHPSQAATVIQAEFNRLLAEALAKLRTKDAGKAKGMPMRNVT